MPSKILLIGEPMGLFIAQTEGPLESINQFTTAVAGAEFNVAVGLSRLGHSVRYLTKLGCDPIGQYIVNTMQNNNIETSLITFNQAQNTGLMLKSKVSSGDPTIYYYRKNSAASSISIEDIQAVDFTEFGYLHLTGIFPALSKSTMEATKFLVRKAKVHGLVIFFDPNLRTQLWESDSEMIAVINELALAADYLLPGVKEGAILTGCNTPEEIADYYMQRGIPNIIIKVGPKGAYLATKDQHLYMPTFEIDRVVDTVGAGDGFAAGVISAIVEGLPIMDAVHRGNAIGSIQVMSVSDNESLPTREQLEKFIKEHKTITVE